MIASKALSLIQEQLRSHVETCLGLRRRSGLPDRWKFPCICNLVESIRDILSASVPQESYSKPHNEGFVIQ